MPRKSPPPPKKASGRNIEEIERRTEAVKLRLQREDAALLRGRAEARGLSLAGYVAELVRLDAAESNDEEWRTWPPRLVQPHERER